MLADALLLSLSDFFEKLAVHARFFRVHLAAQLEFALNLHLAGRLRSCSVHVHLLDQKVLGFLDLVRPLFFLKFALSISNFGLQHPLLHVGTIGAVFGLLDLLFGVNLSVQHVLYLLSLFAGLLTLLDFALASSFILLDALLDVLTFLSLLKFFIFVVDDVSHFVHDGSNSLATLFNSNFALSFTLLLLLNHPLDVFSLTLLSFLLFSKALLLLFLVVTNYLHCSLAFFLLSDDFGLLLIINLLNEPLCLILARLHLPSHLLIPLDLRLLQHLVPHKFVLHHLHLPVLDLLGFDLHLKLGLLENALVEVLLLLELLLTARHAVLDLFVEHRLDFLLFLLMDCFLLADCFFVQYLSVPLNFAPLV
jgi:hypothetical protein